MLIWSFISSKKFYLPLINILKIKDIPNAQIKLLDLIKKWGIKFEDKKNIIPNFSDIYHRLNDGGVVFPEYNGTNYNIYLMQNSKEVNFTEEEKNNNKEEDIDNKNEDSFYYFDNLKNVLKEENFQHKYRRLVSFLLKMNENIKIANQLIDLKQSENLQEIIKILNDGNNTLIDTITGGRLKDEKLMDYTLGTTEDINKTLIREDELKNGNEVSKFTSYFQINNSILKESNNSTIENKKNNYNDKDFNKYYIEQNN
jgi:hypothetical protein